MNQILQSLRLPIENPVLIFSVVSFIILFAPLLFNKIGFPGIIGIIVCGIAVGPNGLNILAMDASIILFGTVGILYLMFFSGLEVDLNDFRRSVHKSFLFGVLTFLIPQLAGTLLSRYLLHFDWRASILLASMFASHTLLAYPIVNKLGIKRNEAVLVTVGGTMVTNTISLLILAVIVSSAKGDVGYGFWTHLSLSVLVFTAFMFFILPRITRAFFRSVQSEGVSQYLFVLAVVFASASFAKFARLEPVIGAFLAGLALNKLIPTNSTLMNRIEFVGNAIFIPFFLIYVGTLVDLGVLFKGVKAVEIALFMTAVATGTKYLAALATQKILGYSVNQRHIIFGLSNAQAANTLAAVLIGYRAGILNEHVLNGTIIMILITCITAAFSVERAGKKMALEGRGLPPPPDSCPERIVVPMSNPATIHTLLDLAFFIKQPGCVEPIYPLTIIEDAHHETEVVKNSRELLEKAMNHAVAAEHVTQLISRIDVSISGGVLRVIKENSASHLIMGWSGRPKPGAYVFGTVLDQILDESSCMVLVSRINHPLSTVKRTVAIAPEHAESEYGCADCIEAVARLVTRIKTPLDIRSGDGFRGALTSFQKSSGMAFQVKYEPTDSLEQLPVITKADQPETLVIVVSSRKDGVSWSDDLQRLPRRILRKMPLLNVLVLYPPIGSAADFRSSKY